MEEKSHIDYDLIAKSLSNNATERENKMLNEWRAAAEENEQEYQALKSIWLATDNQGVVDTEEALSKVLSQVGENADLKNRFSWYAIAAAILFLLTVGSTFWYLSRTDIKHFQTGEQMATMTLSDGSVITLNAASHLEYPDKFDSDTRTVSFTGQGYFSIEGNPTKPFIINTESGEVRVVGTAFEINTKQEEYPLQVTVEEGVVKVSSKSTGSVERVVAGEMARLIRTNELTVEETDNVAPIYWKNKTIRFKRTPLNEVAETLNELIGMEIKLDDQALGSYRLTASFEDEVPDIIMEVIAATLDLELKKEGEVYTLSGKGC
ncbi:MAG: FecR domain-containing protein [Salibacteraceae bacterium]